MNLIDVIRELNSRELDERTKVWFRPVDWQGIGSAYVIDFRDPQSILLVPSFRGGSPAYFPKVYTILDEWEIVNPDDVLDNR